MIRTEFKCPKCGGYKFGSSGSNPELIRHCHGYIEDEAWVEDCGFKFPQSDDWKYFRFVATNQESFERFYKLSSETRALGLGEEK